MEEEAGVLGHGLDIDDDGTARSLKRPQLLLLLEDKSLELEQFEDIVNGSINIG